MKEIRVDIQKKSWRAIKFTAVFLCLSVVWILVSDFTVDQLLTSDIARAKAQTIKGILFVIVATILVYWLSKRAFAKITNETLAEQAARSENLLNTVMSNLGEAVIFVEPESRTIIGCNSTAGNMLGYDKNELIGKTTALIHETNASFIFFGEISEAILQEKGIFRCEYNLKHKNGHVIPAEITVVVFDDNPGWSAGVVSIIRDLSPQKQSEAELRDSEGRYRLLAENTLDVIWQMNADLVFTYVNPAIENQTGYTPSEFIGTHLSQHLAGKEIDRMGQLMLGNL